MLIMMYICKWHDLFSVAKLWYHEYTNELMPDTVIEGWHGWCAGHIATNWGVTQLKIGERCQVT